MNAPSVHAALRRALFVALFATPAAATAGCGAYVSPSDGGRQDVTRTDEGHTCFDPSTGRTLNVGESNGQRCPCVCSDSGLLCAICPQVECRLPDGRTIRAGQSYFDGCNTCTCSDSGALSCTERACADVVSNDAVAPPDGSSCAPVVRVTIPSCESVVTYPCGIPGGPVRSGDPRCPMLCAPAGTPGIDPAFCLAGTAPNSVQCGVCGVGRFTDGMSLSDDPSERGQSFTSWLLRAARVESIAAAAFDRLADELARLGAPESIVAGARQSADDERGHAAVMARFARAEGAVPPSVEPPAFAPRTLEDIAVENAAEGCVRETLGAVVMAWQAEHAADPAFRAALARVAREESRHAAWSWELDAWARGALPAASVRRMDEARARAVAELSRDMAAEPASALADRAGMPHAAAVRAMVSSLHETVWQA